jgi:transcription elongation factor GreB
MSKAFTREPEGGDGEDDDGRDPAEPRLPAGTKNYITPAGAARLRAELTRLARVERPAVVDIVSWAAGNGDRSENGDYLYGKKRLREIDRRLRFLTRRLEIAEIVDPTRQTRRDQVFFGATVTYETAAGARTTVTIVGVDEVDPDHHLISWISPIARALMKGREGDCRDVRTPAGTERLEIIEIRYDDGEG